MVTGQAGMNNTQTAIGRNDAHLYKAFLVEAPFAQGNQFLVWKIKKNLIKRKIHKPCNW